MNLEEEVGGQWPLPENRSLGCLELLGLVVSLSSVKNWRMTSDLLGMIPTLMTHFPNWTEMIHHRYHHHYQMSAGH